MTNSTSKPIQAEHDLRAAYDQLEALSISLRRSNELLRTVFDTVYEGRALLNAEGRIILINQRLGGILGRATDELIGQRWTEVCVQQSLPFPAVWPVSGQIDRNDEPQRVRFECADEQVRMLDIYVRELPATPDTGMLKLITIVDMTERLQVEAQMAEQERFAANGTLTALIAHEVNTPLQAIENCLYMALHVSGSKQPEYINIAQEQLHRVGTLMHQLFELYRPSEQAEHSVDLNELIERLLILVQFHLTRRNITLATRLALNLPLVRGRSHELSQVILHLVMNAIQAMPQGGKLRIATREVSKRPRDGAALPSAGRYVGVSVADTGSGIEPTLQQRIFEPFFTIRPQGSGLGLAVSQKIISHYNGTITVQSAPGQGSTFQVWLPVPE